MLRVLLAATVAAACAWGAHARHNEWMGDMWDTIANRTLKQVTLPGTHDSGAYNLTTLLQPGDSEGPLVDDLIKIAEKFGVPVEDVITPWGLAQDHNLYGQLSGGIRYIDFRAGYNGSHWNTFHFEIGNPVQTLLTDIRRFLDDSSGTEVVVVEVSHTGSAPQSAKTHLADTIVTILSSPYMVPRNEGFVPLATMADRGWRVLVTLDDDTTIQDYPQLWPGSAIHNSYANSPVLKTMQAYNDGEVAAFQTFTDASALFKISWTLTPNADAVLAGFLPGKPRSLKQLADTAAPVLSGWSQGHLKAGNPIGNILIIDHFETSPIADVAAASSALPVGDFPA